MANLPPQEARAAYVEHARAEAKRLHAFGRKLGRSIAAHNFHQRADNLETAAQILSGEVLNLEHHAANAIQVIENGGKG